MNSDFRYLAYWIDFAHFFHFFFVSFIQRTSKKRMITSKIILTPTTKQPKISHALTTTSQTVSKGLTIKDKGGIQWKKTLKAVVS